MTLPIRLAFTLLGTIAAGVITYLALKGQKRGVAMMAMDVVWVTKDKSKYYVPFGTLVSMEILISSLWRIWHF